MKKRIFTIFLALCMVLTLVPTAAWAEEAMAEEPVQEEPMQEEPMQEEPVQEEPVQEEPMQEEPTQEEPMQEEPTQEEPTATEAVQALIDALPDADTITEENRADVEAQLTAIDDAKFPLEDEWDALDFTKYNTAIAALNELDDMGGAEVPEMLEDTLQGNGTEADPWILTKEILDSNTDSFGSVYVLGSGTYRLAEDITTTNTIRVKDAVVTLDLNGYELKRTDSIALLFVSRHTEGSTVSLTLVDSSENKTGAIRAEYAVYIGSNCIFDGGDIPVYGTVINDGIISDGVFYGAVKGYGTINGGIFYGAVDNRINDSAKVTVSFSSDGWTET